MLRLSLLHPHVTIDATQFTAHRAVSQGQGGGGGGGGGGEREGYTQEPDQ